MPKVTARGRGRSIALITLALLAQAIAAGAAAFATRDLFGALANQSPNPSLIALATIGVSGFGIAVCRIIARLLSEKMGQSYALDVRKVLYSHASALPRQLVANRRPGAMSLRFVGDLTALRSWISLGLPSLIAALILVPAMLGVLYLIEPAFGQTTAPLFLGALALMAALGWKLKDINRRLRRARGRVAADMSERMTNAPFLNAAGRKTRELSLLEKRTQDLIRHTLRRVRMAEIVRAVPEILAGLAAALVLWIGFRSDLPTASVAGALAALGLGLQPLRDLALVWNRHAAWRAAYEKCLKALSHELPKQLENQKVKIPKHTPSVSVTEIPLPFTKKFSGSAAAGTKTAIIGTAGAGKSQLMSCLAGHDPANSHKIAINVTPLSDFSAKQRGQLVSLITLDDPLLKGSFRRALTLGLRKRPEDREIKDIAKRLGLGAVMARLGGLDGQIVEGARNLSNGERAASLAARALLAKTPIILLDGIVEGLDPVAVAAINAWLSTSPATIFVACRVPFCDLNVDNVWDLTGA